jgi:uncharacterized membrane protein YraQ (UPF0718 family)
VERRHQLRRGGRVHLRHLLILPIFNIYRKYYGTRMMFVLLGTFYASMVVAGYIVELLFGATGLIPTHRSRVD